MKREVRRLALRKLTLRVLKQAQGGFYASYRPNCSESCNTCVYTCGEEEPTDYSCQYSCGGGETTCYYC